VAVRETGALKEARALAATHSAQAAAALLSLADCEARGALTRLCTQVLQE
jgi:geranylgeranyl pyrophosphate synthase